MGSRASWLYSVPWLLCVLTMVVVCLVLREAGVNPHCRYRSTTATVEVSGSADEEAGHRVDLSSAG